MTLSLDPDPSTTLKPQLTAQAAYMQLLHHVSLTFHSNALHGVVGAMQHVTSSTCTVAAHADSTVQIIS